MKLHSRAALALVISACFSSGAFALGLSSSSAKSALYEPLKAVVRISVDPGENVRAAKFRVASEAEHAQVFVPYSEYAKELAVQVIYQNKTPYLYVTSKKPIYDPSVKVAIHITLPNGGSAIVPVTVLLDTTYDSQMDAVPELSASTQALERLIVKPRQVAEGADATSSVVEPKKSMEKKKPVVAPKVETPKEPKVEPMPEPKVEQKEGSKGAPIKESSLPQKETKTPAGANAAKESAAPVGKGADLAKEGGTTSSLSAKPPVALPPLPSLENKAETNAQKEVPSDAPANATPAATTEAPKSEAVKPEGAPEDKKSEAEKRKEERKAKREAQAKKTPPPPPAEESSFLMDNLMPITAGAGGILALLLGLVFMKRKKKKQEESGEENGSGMSTEDENVGEYPTVSAKEKEPAFEQATVGEYEDVEQVAAPGAAANSEQQNEENVDDFAAQLMSTLSSGSNNPLAKFEQDSLKDEIFNSSGDDGFIERMAKEVGSIAVPGMDSAPVQKANGGLESGAIKDETVLHDPSQLALPTLSEKKGTASGNPHEMEFEPLSFGPAEASKEEFSMPGMDMDLGTLLPSGSTARIDPMLESSEGAKADDGLSFNLNDFAFNNQNVSAASEPSLSLDAFNLDAPAFGAADTDFSLDLGSSSVSGAEFHIKDSLPADGAGRLQMELGVMYAQNEDWEGALSSFQEVLDAPEYKVFHAEAKRLIAMLPKS